MLIVDCLLFIRGGGSYIIQIGSGIERSGMLFVIGRCGLDIFVFEERLDVSGVDHGLVHFARSHWQKVNFHAFDLVVLKIRNVLFI